MIGGEGEGEGDRERERARGEEDMAGIYLHHVFFAF
jgi:hypothetical protein